jgi:hypothetical protein
MVQRRSQTVATPGLQATGGPTVQYLPQRR